jgi:hypothetical protein
MHLIVVHKPLPAAPLFERRRYLSVIPRPLPAAPLVVRQSYLILMPGPLPVEPRSSLQFAKAGSAPTLPQ